MIATINPHTPIVGTLVTTLTAATTLPEEYTTATITLGPARALLYPVKPRRGKRMTDNSRAVASRVELLRRIRGEYLEMPGLFLTLAQAQRLWGLDTPTCSGLLAALTAEKFLWLRADGTYGRTTDCASIPPRCVRVSSHRAAKNS